LNNKKFSLKNAKISDKIYFTQEDLYKDADDIFYEFFNYQAGDSFISTWSQDEETGEISVPSGAFYKIDFESVVDDRPLFEKSNWAFRGTLKSEQQQVADKIFRDGRLYNGLIKAPCGWGKTFLGCYLIANNGKPTVIVVHTKLLAYQWHEALEALIPDQKIGFIGDGRLEVQNITVAIYKTLINNLDTLKNNFEVVFVDEAHLCPAEMFSRVVNGLSARTKIALSATPTRKDGLHVFLSDFFGPNRVTAIDKARLTPAVEIIRTDITFRIRNPAKDWALALNQLSQNDQYINLICDVARRKIAQGRCLLIISERIDMLKRINAKLERSEMLVGATKNTERERILKEAGKSVDVILSTKIFDEGISCHRLDTILFTCPQNNYAKLEQRIGRILREHEEKKFPLIVDFWLKSPIVKNIQDKRLQWYKQQQFHINSF
jgi:superfamily II DNA or RNA helicase